MAHLRAQVEAVLHQDVESGFAVLAAQTHEGEAIRLTGTLAGALPGEWLAAEGLWGEHPRFGRQFRVEQARFEVPATAEDITRMLGAVRGIGPSSASAITEVLGAGALAIFDRSPAAEAARQKLAWKLWKRCYCAWHTHRRTYARDALALLSPLGLNPKAVYDLSRQRDGDLGEQLRADPFSLVGTVAGLGFEQAGRIADRLGIGKADHRRVLGAVRAWLETQESAGHCAAQAQHIAPAMSQKLGLPEKAVRAALDGKMPEGVRRATLSGRTLFYRTETADTETLVGRCLVRLSRTPPPWNRAAAPGQIEGAEWRAGLTLSPSQLNAVERILTRGSVACLTGGPGTGKTQTLKIVLDALQHMGLRIALCAPTGKAARRLSEATGSQALTIHKLLGLGGSAQRPDDNDPLRQQVIIVDEASMLDLDLMRRLLEGMREGSALILVGDTDQLPSVGPGRVLDDLCTGLPHTVARLTEVHRQKGESAIIANAKRVNAGRMPALRTDSEFSVRLTSGEAPVLLDALDRLVLCEVPDRLGVAGLDEVLVLTPMRKGPLGTEALNRHLQLLLNPQPRATVKARGGILGVGDRVASRANSYEKGIVNGEIGTVVDADPRTGRVRVGFGERTVPFERDELAMLTLAYAMTFHKSQGSEARGVICLLADEHRPMLSRKLLYTGVTRGKEQVWILATEAALRGAVARNADAKRITGLAGLLAQYAPGRHRQAA